MRTEAHENLAVWTIRHELYGIERFVRSDRFQQPDSRVHPPCPVDRFEPSRAGRHVHKPQRPEPLSPQPCPDHPTDKPTHEPTPMLCPQPTTELIVIPADLAPPTEPGAIQGYLYGQPVPFIANLLDVVA